MGASKVAWVTGASRGIGRGIAVALGEAGWTVWVTARSTDAASTSHLPGSVEQTARAVTEAGGHGIGVACDHRDDDRIAAVVSRIEGESGALDLLVNNAWAGYERLNAGEWEEWNAPFWEQPLSLWDAMFASGVRAHYVAGALSAPLLRRTPGSLIVTVSVEHSAGHNVAYTVAKTADDRLAQAMAGQLAADGVTSVSLYPGLVRTEGVMQFAQFMDMTKSQSPEGVGRTVAALAADPERHFLTGQALHVHDLAARYGLDVES